MEDTATVHRTYIHLYHSPIKPQDVLLSEDEAEAMRAAGLPIAFGSAPQSNKRQKVAKRPRLPSPPRAETDSEAAEGGKAEEAVAPYLPNSLRHAHSKPPEVSPRFWRRRGMLWWKYSEGIVMDEEGWYSVSPEAMARYLALRFWLLGPSDIVRRSEAMQTYIAWNLNLIQNNSGTRTTAWRQRINTSSSHCSQQPHQEEAKAGAPATTSAGPIPPKAAVLDAFTGVGGNAVQLAEVADYVIAVDIDKVKLQATHHNATVYGVAHKLILVKADAVRLLQRIAAAVKGGGKSTETLNAEDFTSSGTAAVLHSADSIARLFASGAVTLQGAFLAPPWGGQYYQRHKVFSLAEHLTLGDFNGEDLLRAALACTPKVAIYLPKTTSEDDKLPWMSIEYEKQHLEGKLVALMVYFNQLCWGN